MKYQITERQKELLNFIYNSLKTEGYPPRFEDIKTKLNITSNQAIIDHLKSMAKKGLIKRIEKSARTITIKPLGYKVINQEPLMPLKGISHASPITETFELEGEFKTLSSEVQKLQQNVFIIKVSGDSMINAGINDGDFLLVQNQEEFVTGDIILAQTSDGSTVKRFISQDTPPYLCLKPENPKYNVIYFTEDITIKGKIIGKLISGEVKSLAQGRFFE